VYANLFGGIEDCETCQAVIIQASSNNHAAIARAYRQFNPSTEIHYFDDNGQFCDPPAGSEIESGMFKKPDAITPEEPETETPPEVTDESETASAESGAEEDSAGSAEASAEADDAPEPEKSSKRGKSSTDKK
jgi:hypothetical protein